MPPTNSTDGERSARRGTLLGVWAHPDDEAYLSAGLMASRRRNGERVVVVTATAGERGTDDPERWSPGRLAARRRRELGDSLAVLGVVEHQLLGHPDGGCQHVDGTARIAELIEQLRPATIVTFGPDGMTGHPDHRAVSAWTTAAWELTGRSADLWYATLIPGFHRRWGELNDRLGLWSAGGPPSTPPEQLACHLDLAGDLVDRKFAALRAHASQTDPLVEVVGPDTFREWWSTESFVDARTVLRANRDVGALTAGRHGHRTRDVRSLASVGVRRRSNPARVTIGRCRMS